MIDYKILLSFLMFVFSLSIGVGLSYSPMSTASNNSSSCLSQQGIVDEFMSLGGVQLPGNNESQLTGVPQGNLSNNSYMNNLQCNTTTHTSTNLSSSTTSNNADFPKIYKSTIPSIVEITAYNRTNHTIFKNRHWIHL